MAIITLDRVSVELPIYDAHHRSFRRAIVQAGVGGKILQHRRGYAVIRALDEVSLELQPGDRLGLVGHNGAGKSTLLRVLGGLCEPTGGTARIGGATSALLTAASVLDPEMSGHENIDHVATLLGIPQARQRGLHAEIERFTDLGEFLDLPVRTYSAGMAMRLSFALLTAQEPDLLLIDEALGVGDVHFLHQASERLARMREQASILVLVSHDSEQIRQICDKVAWLDHGRLRRIGPTAEILEDYLHGPAPERS